MRKILKKKIQKKLIKVGRKKKKEEDRKVL